MASDKKQDDIFDSITSGYVKKHLLKGRFVKAVMKPGAKEKGTLENTPLEKWVEDLTSGRERITSEQFASSIHYELPVVDELPPPLVHGRRGTTSPPERSFIYLDVGAWVGSKDRKWGQESKYFKRDFGIVCGPLVMLCTFDCTDIKQHCAFWEANKDNKEEPFKSVAKLLDALSGPALSDDPGQKEPLGKAVVREALLSPSAGAEWFRDGEPYIIHVILGDMHIPVLDRIEQTYGDPSIHHGPGKVDWVGRVDLGTLEPVVKALVGVDQSKLLKKVGDLATTKVAKAALKRSAGSKAGSDDEGTAAVIRAKALDAAGAGLVASLEASNLGPEAAVLLASWKAGDWDGIDKDKMSKAEAELWFKYYIEGAPDGGKPADIFEHAGDHFLHFMGRLAAYQIAAAKDPKNMLRAKFVQLGDMVDFWVGFTCHFEPAKQPDSPVSLPDLRGRNLMQVWTKNLFGNTDQGRRVASAVNLAHHVELAPVFLYGNHDNYLSTGASLEYTLHDSTLSFKALGPVQLADQATRYLERRLAHYAHKDLPGVLMEHGHQWDGLNSNDAPGLGALASLTLGTDSPMGMFVTQAAFIRPRPIREWEGTGAGIVAAASGTYGQRLDQIVGAACRFFLAGQGIYCYVMGHTHEACLTTVVVSSRGPDEVKEFQKKFNSDENVAVRIKGVRGSETKHVNNQYGPSEVTVEWVNMLGLPDEWVYLKHDASPEPNEFKNAIKGLAQENTQGPVGSVTFSKVPPGLYSAQYYLTRVATRFFRPSKERILIEGIGIEGDPENETGKHFEHDPKHGFTKPIFLRWAFEHTRYLELSPYFEICRAEHVTEKPLPWGTDQHYTARFSQFGGAESSGRIDLRELGRGGAWDLRPEPKRPVDKWVVRAFSSVDQRPMGEARFDVRHPSHKATK